MTYIYRDDREEYEAAAGFSKLLEELRDGDCMVVERFSGAAKTSKSFLALLETLDARGIRFRSIDEGFDTGTEEGRFAVNILRKVAQLDGDYRREKQREGINNAKEDGKYKGRKPIEVDEEMFDSILEKWKNGEITARQAMNELGLKPNTFYRRVKERMPDAKTTESIFNAAKQLGKDIVSSVAGSAEDLSQAAGKIAQDYDLDSITESARKNFTAAGKVINRYVESISKDLQDAVDEMNRKQKEDNQETTVPAEEPADAEFEVTDDLD